MNIIYHTLSGNTRYIAEQLSRRSGLPNFPVDQAPAGPYLLVTHTFGAGQIPDGTLAFLGQRGQDMRGVVSSGSFHWGRNFARAADLISERWNVPVVAKVNKRGTNDVIQAITAWLKENA